MVGGMVVAERFRKRNRACFISEIGFNEFLLYWVGVLRWFYYLLSKGLFYNDLTLNERYIFGSVMKYVIYYRVSTAKQGVSGLGLEAQKSNKLKNYLQSKNDVVVLNEYVEIDSGKKVTRIELAKAVADAKKNKAVLLVAKLDRVARNVKFFLNY